MNNSDQELQWYNTNKDNYQNSIIQNYLPYTAGNSNMHFLSHDLTRFGEIIEISTQQLYTDGQPHTEYGTLLWVLKVPAGMTVYHSSRSLAVNNAEYPLNYDINLTLDQNRTIEQVRVDNLQDVDVDGVLKKCYETPPFFSWCIANTYFASIPQPEYTHKDNGYLGNQIRYSYGLDSYTESTVLESLPNNVYNDRIANVANDNQLGIAAYQTNNDVYLLAIPDDTFINRGFFGVRNTIALMHLIYQDNFDLLFNDRDYGDPILSASGLSLGANLRRWAKHGIDNGLTPDEAKSDALDFFTRQLFPYIYTIAKNPNSKLYQMGIVSYWYRAMLEFHQGIEWFDSGYPLEQQIKQEFRIFLNYIYEHDTAGNIPINEELINIYGRAIIPGIRMSDYEADRPWHTQIRELLYGRLLEDRNGNQFTIDGMLGGLLFNPRWCPFGVRFGAERDDDCRAISTIFDFQNGILVPTRDDGFFHSELISFYAPDILDRDYNNIHDYRYKLNSLGILTELRKYKTSNILTRVRQDQQDEYINFHQGHLYEHSAWTALQSYLLDTDVRNNTRILLQQSNVNELLDVDPRVIITAAILHDIGKAGDCFYEEPPTYGDTYNPQLDQTGIAYKDYNPHTIPKPYWCKVIKDGNNQLGFTYYDHPIHPERGYRYLKGLSGFQMYSFKKSNDATVFYENYRLVSLDWEKYRTTIGLEEWYQLKLVRIAVACHWDFGPIASSYTQNPSEEIVARYLRKIERYYNAEFGAFDLEMFIKSLYVTMIISIGDIYGSLYNPQLRPINLDKIYNEFPNYHIYRAMIQYCVNKLTDILSDQQYYQQVFGGYPDLINYVMRDPIDNSNVSVEQVFNAIYNEQNATIKADLFERFYYSDTTIYNTQVWPMQIIMSLIFQYEPVLENKLAEYITAAAAFNSHDDLGRESPPQTFAGIARNVFYNFISVAVQMLQSGRFVHNPYNNYMVLENLLHSYDNVPALYYGHTRFAPKVLIFDLDETFLLQGDWIATDKQYTYYPDVPRILEICKVLREKFNVKIAIASRHYIPKVLLEEIVQDTSPLYYKNFDLIISQYTGPINTLTEFCEQIWPRWLDTQSLNDRQAIERCKRYLEPCNAANSQLVTQTFGSVRSRNNEDIPNPWDTQSCRKDTYGFIIYNGQYYVGEYGDAEQDPFAGKGPHMNIITRIFGLPAKDMILFDDNVSYINGEQLGGHKVYTAGVDGRYGLTEQLFYVAIAMYIYEKFTIL